MTTLSSHRRRAGHPAGPTPTWGSPLLGLPFDALRWGYASGVQSGLIPLSLLAAHRYELAVAAAERMALGPWARAV